MIAAFKGISIVKTIFGDLTKAILWTFKLLTAHPIIAGIALLVGAGIYLYTHWEEISEWIVEKWQWLTDLWNSWTFEDILAPVLGFILNVANYFEENMNELFAWWNNLKFSDIFQPIFGFILSAANYVEEKMSGLSVWWDNLKLSDIFAPIYDFAVELIAKVKQPFIDLKNWIINLFANLNPFNWQMPSWLRGGVSAKITPQQVDSGKKEMTQKYGSLDLTPSYMKGNAYATGGIITQPEIALIGEAGREAVIPLEDRTHGLPLLRTAMNELLPQNNFSQVPVTQNIFEPIIEPENPILQNNFSPNVKVPEIVKAQSSPLLIQQVQNQAGFSEKIQAPDKPVNVISQVDVKVESRPVEIYLDREKIGTTLIRWITRQNVRNGVSEY